MKKKIILLATMLFTVIGFAGTKEDFELAVKKYNENNNIVELEKSLVSISKAKSDTYTRQAKFQLAKLKLSQGNSTEAMKYITDLEKDKSIESELLANVYYLKYTIETTNTKKIDLLNKIIKLMPEEKYPKVLLLTNYRLEKNNSKADSLYKTYTNKLSIEDKDVFDSLLLESYLNSNLVSEVSKLATTLLKSKENSTKTIANYYLAYLDLSDKKYDEAIKKIKEASKTSEGKLEIVETLLYNAYLAKGDNKNAIDQLVKLKNLTKNTDTYAELILLSEKTGNTKVLNETLDELKKVYKENLNYDLAAMFNTIGEYDLSIKYAKLSLENDKYLPANTLLAINYAQLKDEKNALKYIDDAIKAKVENSEQIKKDIQEFLNKNK